MKVVNVTILRSLGQAKAGASVKQYFKRDFQFQPRQWCAYAKVDTATKAGVLRALAGWIKNLWFVIGEGITVRST